MLCKTLIAYAKQRDMDFIVGYWSHFNSTRTDITPSPDCDRNPFFMPFAVGTCALDPGLPVFISIALILLIMLISYIYRNQIKSCINWTPLYRYE